MSVLIKKFPVNPFPVNCFVIWDEETKEAAIIDPGYYWEEERKIIKDFVESNSLKVKYILLTHMHFDHVISLSDIKDMTGASIMGNKNDEFLLANAARQAASFGLQINYKDVAIDKYLTEKDELNLGKNKIIIFEVPGHSPGSLVYYIPSSKILITGDVLFRQSIGRTDLPGGDYDTLINGIKSKLLTLPDDTIVYSGHGAETNIGYEKKYNSFLQ